MEFQLDRRRLNNRIRRSEARFASKLSQKLWHRKSLESDLEWLITWAIKKVKTPESMWCSSAKISDLKRVSNKQLTISATVEIGPESNAQTLSEAQLKGSITLNGHGNKLKAYSLLVSENGTIYELQK